MLEGGGIEDQQSASGTRDSFSYKKSCGTDKVITSIVHLTVKHLENPKPMLDCYLLISVQHLTRYSHMSYSVS